jgi:ribosomal protein S18 acetylase RimI-like enzyme
VRIRRLGPDDGHILQFLAVNDPAFDVEGRGHPLDPLNPTASQEYLRHPAVLHWVAWDDSATEILGFLQCVVVPRRTAAGPELLLYEIGVHQDWRRRGVGRSLVDTMHQWMRENHIADVWVLADNPEAQAFYASVGFTVPDEYAQYMVRTLLD